MPPAVPAADLEALVVQLSAVTTRRDGLSRTAAATLTRLATSGPARLTDLASFEPGAWTPLSRSCPPKTSPASPTPSPL